MKLLFIFFRFKIDCSLKYQHFQLFYNILVIRITTIAFTNKQTNKQTSRKILSQVVNHFTKKTTTVFNKKTSVSKNQQKYSKFDGFTNYNV